MSVPRKFCRKCGWKMEAGTVCPGCGFEHAAASARPPVHDAQRDAILSRAVSVRTHEVPMTTLSLHALLRLAASEKGQMEVADLCKGSSGRGFYVPLECLEPLLKRGWVRRTRGVRDVAITDAGNAVVRAMLAWVRQMESEVAR